jgi:hypothetical protein
MRRLDVVGNHLDAGQRLSGEVARMTTLDEARAMARQMRESPHVSLDIARVLDWLIAMVEANENLKVDGGMLVQRVLRVMDHDVSGLTRAELAEQIVKGISDLIAGQIGHPQRLADARRAGEERMRERAAREAEAQFLPSPPHACTIAAAIRALPIEE